MIKYEIKDLFNHYYTEELLYRVKITYSSGGVAYQVMNQEQIKLINLGE